MTTSTDATERDWNRRRIVAAQASRTRHCHHCGGGLGLNSMSWRRRPFCGKRCRDIVRGHWWRDFRDRWLNRLLLRPP